MISPGVMAPGSSGTLLSRAASMSCGVAPGLTMKREPAFDGLVILTGIENGSRADDGLRHFIGDGADGVESCGSAQRDLDCRQAALGKRPRQRNGIGNDFG